MSQFAPAGPRALKKAAVAQRILDVARAAFVAQGVHKADLADIAQQAKIGRATLYRYYDGREALVLALMAEDWDKQAELFARLTDEPFIDSAVITKWLARLIRATAARLSSFPIFHSAHSSPLMSGLLAQRHRLMNILGARFPAFALAQGQADASRVEALLLLFQIEQFVAHAAAASDQALTNRGVEVITDGLLKLHTGQSSNSTSSTPTRADAGTG